MSGIWRDDLSIEADWRAPLASVGLANLGALLDLDLGEVVQATRGREVRRISLPGRAGQLYVKRVAAPSLPQRVRTLARGRARLAGAEGEAAALLHLRGLGISAARPIAWGARRSFGAAGEGVLVTEAASGEDLSRVLATASYRERRALLEDGAALLARMHAHDLFHEVRPRDLIASLASATGERLTLIDRDPKNVLRHLAKGDPRSGLICLARCDYLSRRAGLRLSGVERWRFLRSYLARLPGAPPFAESARLIALRLALELARHRADPALVREFGALEA
ncbi:MAG TPA: lipopolysaccharide kinase InaA family protein [Myxococcota bacterium]|jgi:hypothetical protein